MIIIQHGFTCGIQDFFSTNGKFHMKGSIKVYATGKWTTRPKTKMYTKQDGVEDVPLLKKHGYFLVYTI